jgi:hypothetical protein
MLASSILRYGMPLTLSLLHSFVKKNNHRNPLFMFLKHIAVPRFLSRPQSKTTFPTDDSRHARKSELMRRLKHSMYREDTKTCIQIMHPIKLAIHHNIINTYN